MIGFGLIWAFLIIFVLYPLTRIFYDAFSNEAGQFTLANFHEFFTDRFYLRSLWNSLLLGVATVVTTSVIGIAGRAPYASAKAGVTSLTRVLALEWAAQGVTVNAICPGPFGTDMNKPLLNDPVKYQEFVKNLPIGRWGELDELAGLVVFLASPASSFITGSSIFIDGGWTAR